VNDDEKKRWCLILECQPPPGEGYHVCEDHFNLENTKMTKNGKRRKIKDTFPIPITTNQFIKDEFVQIRTSEGMSHSLNKSILACISPFVRQLLLDTGEEDCVIYLPSINNSSVRYLLEMMHTGCSSQMNKTEVGNLKMLLEILGCRPEMGFSIEKSCKKITLDNLDEDELNGNLYKTVIYKNAVLTRKGEEDYVHSLQVESYYGERKRERIDSDRNQSEPRVKKRYVVHL